MQGGASCGENPAGGFYARYVKTLLDRGFAAAGLLLVSPLLLVCGVAIRMDSKGPVFFRQWRVGKGERSFQIIKLRTMVEKAEQEGGKITAARDPRITRVGRLLRMWKVDELPQLLNVLRGEMSLVGPRPEVPEYVASYNDGQREVLCVRPGITSPSALIFIDEEGLLEAQSEREDFYTKELMSRKLDLDLEYCRDISLCGDLRLIALTFWRLMCPGRRGATVQG